jgi:heme oxygenase (biliverdin-IX-beta and delta-forming)
VHRSRESAHAVLRRETAHLHNAVEVAFASFDLTTRTGLSRFLAAQVVAVGAVEDELDRRGIGDLVEDWSLRRRKSAALADLARLRGDPASEAAQMPHPLRLESVGQQLGSLYVLEGSRLGGRLLARHVEGSPDELVRAAIGFLRAPVKAGAWAALLTLLDTIDPPRDELLAGAVATFTVFEAAASHAASAA